MSLLWSERISPIFLAINLLLLWSRKSHFYQTTSLKKSKKFPDFRIFFPCPQRGQNVNRNYGRSRSAPEVRYQSLRKNTINVFPSRTIF